MQGTRIMRFVGNREKPELELFDNSTELALRSFPGLVALAHGDLVEFSRTCPNPLFSDMKKSEEGVLFVPQNFNDLDLVSRLMSSYNSYFSLVPPLAVPKPQPKEEPFEVNLTEALVGWRSWEVKDYGSLLSMNFAMQWKPDEPLVARCPQEMCSEVPTTFHTCGVYAVDDRNYIPAVEGNGTVVGTVYGWGAMSVEKMAGERSMPIQGTSACEARRRDS